MPMIKPKEGLWYWPQDDLLIECEKLRHGMWLMTSERGHCDYLEDEDPCIDLVYIGKIV